MKRLEDYYTCFDLKCFLVRVVLFPGIHTFPSIFLCFNYISLSNFEEKKLTHQLGLHVTSKQSPQETTDFLFFPCS